MSGSAKRVHDDFGNNFPSGNASPAVKQHEEQYVSTSVNRDITPAELGGHAEINSESRPLKLPGHTEIYSESRPLKVPRLDHTNRFQKRSGNDDPVSNSPSFSVENKTDPRDGKLKSTTDEKVSLGDVKMSIHEDKGDVDAWKDRRVDSGHDTDRSNRNGSSSSSWRRERVESREDSREAWKDSIDDKWESKAEANEEKGERDSLKDGRSDPNNDSKAAMVERGNRGNVIRRDHRFDHKDDASWKEHRDHRLGGRPVVDNKDWSKRLARKNSTEEDGEVRDSEEASMETYKREEERRPKDDSTRDKDDKEREQKASFWSPLPNNPPDSGARERWDKEKEKHERGREKEKEKRDHIVKDHAVNEDIGTVKQELEDYEATKKPLPETVVSNTELERKSSKELENSKVMDSDEKERKKERDREKKVDHERSIDKKETEEQVPDDERDKDSFVNYGFQQKKRMLRPRGHPQSASRDGRPRPKDLDGSSGGAEVTTILYKPGEYMSELSKLWKEYESSLAQKNGEGTTPGQGPTLEIQIPSKLVTTSNHQVRSSQLWGTDVYTDDSDLVAVLMHTGYYRPTASHPPPSVQELRATIRVMSPLDSYTSTLRNNIRSRAWGAASGCSYSVEQCRIVKVGGGHIDLEPCLTRISAVAPTLAPAAMERTMTTRAASSNAYRQHRFVQEVTIQYNLCNEPWMKYSMSIVADRGLKKSQYTSARLRKGEVLYVETHRKRYELSYDSEKVACIGATTATSDAGDKNRHKDGDKSNGEKSQGRPHSDKVHQNGDAFDHYKWSCCKQPLPLKVMLAKGVPLPNDFVEVIEDGLAWEEIQWSQAGVWVRGKEYPLARAQFLSQNLDSYE